MKAQLAELELRVLAASADVAEEHGSRDAGCWLAHTTHTTRITSSAGRAQLRLAESLEQHPLTAAALRSGAVNEAQARVIIRAVDKLSDAVDHSVKIQAEAHLIELAATHDPRDLQILGTKILELLDPQRLPDHSGDATTVMVTIPFDTLTEQLGSAMLGDTVISASEARRLACTAKIIPVVLGGKSEILDLGRAHRLFQPPQRKALRLRDKRCRAEGCSIPAAWCEAHHLKPWSEGGKTDLADGVLLCSHHHHRAHDTRYSMTKLSSGDYRFHRRT